MRAATIRVWLSAPVEISPAPTVCATAVPTSAPAKFAAALMTIAYCGLSARVETDVAIARTTREIVRLEAGTVALEFVGHEQIFVSSVAVDRLDDTQSTGA